MSKRRRMILWAFGVVVLAAIAAAAAGPIMSRVEQPEYQVISLHYEAPPYIANDEVDFRDWR